jgi:hypothetical protein
MAEASRFSLGVAECRVPGSLVTVWGYNFMNRSGRVGGVSPNARFPRLVEAGKILDFEGIFGVEDSRL